MVSYPQGSETVRKVERLACPSSPGVFRDMLGTLRDAANVDPVLANDVLDQMFAAIVLEDSGELTFTPREAWRPFLGM